MDLDGKVLREVYIDAKDEIDDVGKRFLEEVVGLEDLVEELVDRHAEMSPLCRLIGRQAMETESECGICGKEFEEEDTKVIDHEHYTGR